MVDFRLITSFETSEIAVRMKAPIYFGPAHDQQWHPWKLMKQITKTRCGPH